MYEKVNPVRDVAGRRAWMRMQDRCQCCRVHRSRTDFRGLSCHHIVKFKRSDEPTNYLCLCGHCHSRAEGVERPKLTLAECCRLKRVSNPDEFNLARLEQLRGSPIEMEG